MNDARHLEGGFRYAPRTSPLRSVIEGVREGGIIITPQFRYHRSWPKALKVQLIESVLLGIPIPDIWCEENHYGDISILEGAHLLDCFIEFFNNEFPLTGASIFPDLDGCYFSDLPFRFGNSFIGRTVVELRIISYDTAPLLKYQFFKLLNIEKRDFIPQVARNYAFPEVGYFVRNLMEECEHLLTFESSANPYTQASFKRPFEVDRVYLFITALVLLKKGFLAPVDGDIEALLDEAMLFLNDSTETHRILSTSVKHCLAHIVDGVDSPLWVYFGPSKAKFMRNLKPEGRTSVDELLHACVQVLSNRYFSDEQDFSSPTAYLRHPTTRRLYNDLL